MSFEDCPILVLEDDENDALLLRRALKKIHFHNPVHVVSDGEEGIAYLTGAGKYHDRAAFPLPGFIITDLKMPKKSGLEVLQWLREHPQFRIVPTLVLTSCNVAQDVAKAYRFGANSYMVKPSDCTDLERRVQLILNYWEACETPHAPAA
ncbi:MAG: response regulator [Verrucomicrobiota bacterium]